MERGDRITDLNAFAAEVHENAIAHGWWDKSPDFATIALMSITEIAEATDEYRNDMPMCYVMKKTCSECPDYPAGAHYMETDMSKWTPEDKPEGVAVEMADCIVAKNRHGETGRVKLRWVPEYTCYE